MNSITRTRKHNYSMVERILAGSPPDVERLRDISTVCSPARQWIDYCPRQNITHGVFMSTGKIKMETHAFPREKGERF